MTELRVAREAVVVDGALAACPRATPFSPYLLVEPQEAEAARAANPLAVRPPTALVRVPITPLL